MYTYTVYKSNYSNAVNDGVAIAVRSTLTHKLIEGFEHLLAVEVETNNGPVIIATTYLPPRREIFPTTELTRFSKFRKPSYLFGDLNAKHEVLGYGERCNLMGRNLAAVMATGRVSHIGPDFPTFIRRDCATTPDIALRNQHSHLHVAIEPGPLSTTSDHLPMVATISANPIMVETATTRDRYDRADWEGMQRHLQALPVTTNLRGATLNEIEEEVEKWYTDVLEAKRLFIPKARYKTTAGPRADQDILNLQTMFSNIQNLAHTRGWTQELKDRYLQLRHELSEKWTIASQNAWENIIARTETHYNDPKKFWQDIKNLSGRKNYVPDTYVINERDEKVWTAREKEAVHRRYWNNIFRITEEENRAFDNEFEREITGLLDNQRELTQPSQTADFNVLEYDNPLTRRITPREIKTTIKSFKNGKAAGGSGVNKAILEKLPNKMVGRLCNIFNACLAAGYFPGKFKSAILRLIPKEGKDPHRVEGKRPISLLECPGKVLEKIVNTRLRNFLMDHDKYNKRQHGFRQGRGTHTAISVVYETASIALSDRIQTNVVLRDVSKAFDKVWHDGLKYKLIRLELPDCITRFCCNFLDGRTARIKLGQYLGEEIHLRSGVPQGSCLSPTLYTIYTADLPDPTGSSEYVAYADDITQVITCAGHCTRRMALQTSAAITSINEYERKWKIATNQDKFQVIPLAKYTPYPLRVEGRGIEYSVKGNILGLELGKTGLRGHVNARAGQAFSTLTKLKRFGKLSESIKAHLYKALIRPVLEYPPVPLDTLSITQTMRLQVVQNAAVRWIAGWVPPYTETQEMAHTRLRLEPINVRVHRMSRRTWQRVETYDEDAYQRLTDAEPRRTHRWFPRSLTRVNPPEEKYITGRMDPDVQDHLDYLDYNPDDPGDP